MTTPIIRRAASGQSILAKVLPDQFSKKSACSPVKRFLEVLRLANTLGIDIQEWQNLMEAALQIDGGQIAAEISQKGISTNHGTQIHQALAHARLLAITRTLDQ